MNLIAESDWVVGVLLISVRLAALLLASPLFSLARLPARISVLFVLVLAVLINDSLDQYSGLSVHGFGPLLKAACMELAVGALLAFGVNCAFAAFSFGGRVLDLQMGFGVANLVNPSTNEHAPLMGTLLLVVGVMTFFLLNGHHWLVRGILHSFQWLPLGAPLVSISLPAILRQFGLMFSFGFIMVAPVVVVLLLMDVAMAIASRSMPQMNMFMLSMPLKIMMGFGVLALSAPYMRNLLQRIFESIFTYWGGLV